MQASLNGDIKLLWHKRFDMQKSANELVLDIRNECIKYSEKHSTEHKLQLVNLSNIDRKQTIWAIVSCWRLIGFDLADAVPNDKPNVYKSIASLHLYADVHLIALDLQYNTFFKYKLVVFKGKL